jgi:ATP-dependent DNA ligase
VRGLSCAAIACAFSSVPPAGLPLRERRRRLEGIIPKRSSVISEALSVQVRGRELLELMQAHDLEGIVAKRLDDSYEPRTPRLARRRPRDAAFG